MFISTYTCATDQGEYTWSCSYTFATWGSFVIVWLDVNFGEIYTYVVFKNNFILNQSYDGFRLTSSLFFYLILDDIINKRLMQIHRWFQLLLFLISQITMVSSFTYIYVKHKPVRSMLSKSWGPFLR